MGTWNGFSVVVLSVFDWVAPKASRTVKGGKPNPHYGKKFAQVFCSDGIGGSMRLTNVPLDDIQF